MHEDDILNCFPERLREDEIPRTVYPVPSETFNYVNTIKMINTNETRTYGTGIISCNCTNSKYLNHYHGKIITEDSRILLYLYGIIENKKLRKIISKGSS